MTRRWWGVAVLVAAALLFYLITPDSLPGQESLRPATLMAYSAFDSAHHTSGQPQLSSDGVAVLSRSFVPSSATEQAAPIHYDSGLATTNALGCRGAREAVWQILALLRPDLSLLQILRC